MYNIFVYKFNDLTENDFNRSVRFLGEKNAHEEEFSIPFFTTKVASFATLEEAKKALPNVRDEWWDRIQDSEVRFNTEFDMRLKFYSTSETDFFVATESNDIELRVYITESEIPNYLTNPPIK